MHLAEDPTAELDDSPEYPSGLDPELREGINIVQDMLKLESSGNNGSLLANLLAARPHSGNRVLFSEAIPGAVPPEQPEMNPGLASRREIRQYFARQQ